MEQYCYRCYQFYLNVISFSHKTQSEHLNRLSRSVSPVFFFFNLYVLSFALFSMILTEWGLGKL